MEMVLVVEMVDKMIMMIPDVMTMTTISPSQRKVSPPGISLLECFYSLSRFRPQDGGGKIM